MSSTIGPAAVEEAGLHYTHDDAPGIRRVKRGSGFSYVDPSGSAIGDRSTIQRIRSLAIPPAYSDVWINPDPNGHIQATGRDARGRKQYRYHPKYLEASAQGKFSRMIAFAEVLPRIRSKVDAELATPGLSKDKVVATVVWFLEKSLIRVGNDEYARQNHSYGLTTMKMRHCTVQGAVIQFQFKGKRGIPHTVEIADRRMARIVKRVQELPGQMLFAYEDENGEAKPVTSTDVNDFLKDVTGGEFTAKDFRTWAATVDAFVQLSDCGAFQTLREAKHAVTETLGRVAKHLGNTPAVCRKSYVHPAVIDCFVDRSLAGFLDGRQEGKEDIEELTVAFLKCAEARHAADNAKAA